MSVNSPAGDYGYRQAAELGQYGGCVTLVSWMYRIETTGVNLDRIGETATSEPEDHRRAVA
jgi:hypothetical protein